MSFFFFLVWRHFHANETRSISYHPVEKKSAPLKAFRTFMRGGISLVTGWTWRRSCSRQSTPQSTTRVGCWLSSLCLSSGKLVKTILRPHPLKLIQQIWGEPRNLHFNTSTFKPTLTCQWLCRPPPPWGHHWPPLEGRLGRCAPSAASHAAFCWSGSWLKCMSYCLFSPTRELPQDGHF